VPLDLVVKGLLTGLVYGLGALGLSVIYGVVRIVNFAHGEMMTAAMYIAVLLFAWAKVDPLVAILPVALLAFVFGFALQRTVINPFVTRPEHTQFMLLVAVAMILVNAQLIIFGPDARNVMVDYQLESFELGALVIDKARAYAALAAVAVAAALFAFFRFSLTGKAIRACADNQLGARVVGLNVDRLYALTFIVVIVGGMGSLPGALLAGVVIGVSEALAGFYFTPSAKSMFTFALLVLVLLFRPQGLLGRKAA
jgi:branched-chain amino acid transport system permease protein